MQVKFVRVSNTGDMAQIHLETLINDFLDQLSQQDKVQNVTITKIGNDIIGVILYQINGA